MEKLKIGSWNILSTERILGIDENFTHVINDRPRTIIGHSKLYEVRYTFIANQIIDLFNQDKLDILFIQEADQKFLDIFNLNNDSLNYKYHFIEGSQVDICLLIIYNQKYSSFGDINGFDDRLINETQNIYRFMFGSKYPLRALPLFLFNLNNGMPLLLINIHNSPGSNASGVYHNILLSFMELFGNFDFVSKNIPVIIGGDLNLSSTLYKQNLPNNFFIQPNMYDINNRESCQTLVEGYSVHPFLRDKNGLLSFIDDENLVSDILFIHNVYGRECLKYKSNNESEQYKDKFKSPYVYHEIPRINNQTRKLVLYHPSRLYQYLELDDRGVPNLYSPLSDHNIVISELEYNEPWLDVYNFKKLLFYFLKNKLLIVEPYNIGIFREAFIPGNLVELPFKDKKHNQRRKRRPLTLKKPKKNKKSNNKNNKKTKNKNKNKNKHTI